MNAWIYELKMNIKAATEKKTDPPGWQTNRFLYNNSIPNNGIHFVGILTVLLAHSLQRFTIS